MTCAVCSADAAALTRGLCPTCAGATQTVEAVAHVHDRYSRRTRHENFQRSDLFRHAREVLAGSNPQDMRQVASRLPHSKRGDSLRKRLLARAEELEG
jgi:hypothetical protein